MMNSAFKTLAIGWLLLIAGSFCPSGANAAAPVVGEVFWHPSDAYCAFRKSGTPEPESSDPAGWRFLFVTELVSDDIASAERGYMRIDGLLRELQLTSRMESEDSEKRKYQTFGSRPVTIEIEMADEKSEKSKLGQTVLVHYTGTLTVERGRSLRLISFKGACGVDPGS